MKKFREILDEAKADSHHEALKIVSKHASDTEDATDDDRDGRLHLAGVHKDHVAKLHKALEKHGFKKQAEKVHPQMGVRSGGGGDGKVYHHFKKGNTSVHISDSANTGPDGNTSHHQTHHFAEVHTPKHD